MRIAYGTLAVLALGTSLLVGCDTGTTKPNNAVFFGPGSAPNQGGAGTGPAAGGFTMAGALNDARISHTATLLADDRVLVVGGRSANPFTLVDESEIYDPATDTWTRVSDLPANAGLAQTANPGAYLVDPTGQFATLRMEHAATIFLNGTVLITGGAGVQAFVGQPVIEALDTVYRFEPSANQFQSVAARMPVPRYFHLSSVMVNGDVIVVAGYGIFGAAGNAALLSADAFNAVTGWSSLGTGAGAGVLGSGHTHGNLHLMQGDVVIVNGLFVDGVPTNPQQPPPNLTVRMVNPGVLMPGGSVNGNFAGTSGENFDPTIGQATFVAGPQSTREQFPSGVLNSGSVTVSTGDVFFAGGENLTAARDTKDVGAIATTELLGLQTRAFVAGPLLGSSLPALGPPAPPGTPAPPTPFTETECMEIGFTSDVMTIGGIAPTQAPTTQSEQFNYLNNFMVGVSNLNEARSGHKLVKLPNNRILVIGGLDDANPREPKATCEIWSR
jgi:hypothetical protein